MLLLSHTHTHQKEVLHLFPALLVEKSYIKIMANKWRRPSWIYGKLVYYHRFDYRDFLICFPVVDSELFGVLFFGYSVIFNRFGNFYNYNIFFLIKICSHNYNFVDLCYVDTHVESHAIT